MEADPNADLIGYEFETDRGLARITGSSQSSPGYVDIEAVDGTWKSVRPAQLVRVKKVWDEAS